MEYNNMINKHPVIKFKHRLYIELTNQITPYLAFRGEM